MEEMNFSDLGLSPQVLEAVQKAGYEVPSPIQQKAIPVLLKGKNLLGTAQTGTGKTAAFSLPLLSKLDFSHSTPAMLVLTPTRELSIQVAEAIQSFAVAIPKVRPHYENTLIEVSPPSDVMTLLNSESIAWDAIAVL